MRKLPAFFLLLFFALSIQAQQFDVSTTPETKLPGLYSMVPYGDAFLGFDVAWGKMQLAYTFKLAKLKFGIRMVKYDRAMNLVKENKLVGGEKTFGPFQPFVQKLNGRLYLVYCEMTPGAEEGNLLVKAAQVDTASLELIQPKLLFTLDQKNLGLFKSMDAVDAVRLSLQQSPDRSKIVAIWSSGLDNDMYLSLLDENLNPLWTKKQTVKSADQITINTTCVDNQGDVLITYRTRPNRDEFQSHVWIFRQGKPAIDKEVKLPEGHPHELHLVASASEPVVNIVGTYVGETDMINGAYIVPLNTTDGKLGKPVQTAIPDALIELFHKDGWASTKKKHYGLNMVGLEAHALEDGSIDMTGMFRSSNNLGRVIQQTAGDILLIHLNKGKAVFGRIPKYRVSAESMIGDAYFTFPWKNKTVIFYDDKESNLKQSIEQGPQSSNVYKSLVLVAATMSEDGTIKREKILDLQDDHYLAVTDAIRILSSSSLLAPLWKIKGMGGISDYFRWGRIEIK